MNTATVSEALRVHGDLKPAEIDVLIEHWHKLDQRLRAFASGTVQLDLHLKDRDRPGQHLTLEATIDRLPPLVATTSEPQLERALNVVRDEMVRLIGDHRDKHHPRHRDHGGRSSQRNDHDG